MQKTALVTGATSGIGRATAFQLSTMGFELIITGRRAERLAALSAELAEQGTSCTSLCFDIQKKEAVDQAMDELGERLQQIDLLVNNAGLAATAEPIQAGDWNDWERMIDTNVKGLLAISRRIIPGMMERRDRKSTRLNSSHVRISYAVFCLKK